MRRCLTLWVGLTVVACAARDSAERAPPASPETASMPTAPLARTPLTETTIDTILGLRVGVGSLWDADWTNPDGTPGHGPTAMVAVADESGTSLFRKRLHAGEAFVVEGREFRVVEVVVLESALGHVVLEHSHP